MIQNQSTSIFLSFFQIVMDDNNKDNPDESICPIHKEKYIYRCAECPGHPKLCQICKKKGHKTHPVLTLDDDDEDDNGGEETSRGDLEADCVH